MRRVEKAMLAKENFLSQTPSAVTLFCSDELFFFCHPTPRMTRYFTMESGMSSYYVIFSHFPIHTAFLTESRERVSLKLFFYHAGQLSSKTFRSLLEPLFKLFRRKTVPFQDRVTRSRLVSQWKCLALTVSPHTELLFLRWEAGKQIKGPSLSEAKSEDIETASLSSLVGLPWWVERKNKGSSFHFNLGRE